MSLRIIDNTRYLEENLRDLLADLDLFQLALRGAQEKIDRETLRGLHRITDYLKQDIQKAAAYIEEELRSAE